MDLRGQRKRATEAAIQNGPLQDPAQALRHAVEYFITCPTDSHQATVNGLLEIYARRWILFQAGHE